MDKSSVGIFYQKIHNKSRQFPLDGQIDLTYRCNLNCVHCYCKGSEDKKHELNVSQWKKILDQVHRQGCIWLTFTGGEPLLREDFLEIYAYAKKKGFIILIFTNGQLFNRSIVSYLVKAPPYSIEITLNGATPNTYEKITQVKGSFPKVVENIRLLAKNKLPLLIKANLLKQNKDEIGKIKKWSELILGKPFKFQYDTIIYPRLNGDRAPCKYRLSFPEALKVIRRDPDMWKEYREKLDHAFSGLSRDGGYLYHCNAWMKQFFINPYGKLKFCAFYDKFSVDLKKVSFKEGFYRSFPQLLKERFKTDSKCRSCQLRPFCYFCPARAYLENASAELPVDYYCEFAKGTAEQAQSFLNERIKL
jgi:radical SAM protein with 4Fe4S-binding SPASM domain